MNARTRKYPLLDPQEERRKSRQPKCRNQCSQVSLVYLHGCGLYLQHDSLEKIVRPVLEDENVIAVGGSVRPANGVVIKKVM